MSKPEKLSTKLVDQVVALIEKEYNNRVDATCPSLYEHQELSQAREDIKGKLKSLAAVKKADEALKAAKEKTLEELSALAPKSLKLCGDFSNRLDMLANEHLTAKRKSRIELRKEMHKFIARARMAKTQDSLEKILSDAEIL